MSGLNFIIEGRTRIKPIFAAALSLVALGLLASPQNAPSDASQLEAVVQTEMGEFRFAFAPDAAPKHVAEFINRARSHYYDGSAFFRVVPDGIIQGGDPLLKNPNTPRAKWGSGGLNLLPTEISSLKHERGAVSTIRLPDKLDSDGAQFFVCVTAQPALDGKYSVFGQVLEGIDTVERISRVAATNGITDKPVRIISIAVEPKKTQPFADSSVDELRRSVTLRTTLGVVKIQMQPDWAPETVRNFLTLTATGWYNGTAFHRLVKGFVAQGGMSTGRASGPYHPADRWVHSLKAEFRPDVKHVRGIVSMAHGDDPESATTSFFIVLAPAPSLDGKFAAFGRITEGLDVLDAFEKEEVDGETPKRRLEIVDASIDPAR